MNASYKFSIADFESQIDNLIKNKVTEISIYDEKVAKDKKLLLKVLSLIYSKMPDVFVSVLADASVIDREVLAVAANVFCAFDIPLVCSQKGGKLLFDKKFYASKARILNENGFVFGFNLSYADTPGDSLKAFMERLDFAVNQYPNHIEFPQTENSEKFGTVVSGTFSAQDIRRARDISFACRLFYSAGRAVPWFLAVLKPLRIYPSRFFADFAEWQRCNNCDFKSGFIPENESHSSIEKMQLLFLEEKYEEKKCSELLTAVKDVVKINGAMSRLAGENEESVVKTSYSPDDLFSEEACDIEHFCENVCMENCSVKIFSNGDSPDYEIL